MFLFKRSKLIRDILISCCFLVPFSFYIYLAFLYAGADPHTPAFVFDAQYDIPRNENIIFHLSRDWSSFSFLDAAYFKHPPLFFYMGALAFRLGTETGLLLLMALISIASVVLTYFFIKKLYGRRTALMTALLLAYAPGFFDTSFYVMFDIGTSVLFLSSAFLIYKSFSRDSWPLMILSGAVGGLMLLYKTVSVVLYPGCFLFLILMYRSGLISRVVFHSRIRKMIWVVLISLIIYLPWLIYQKINFGAYPWMEELFFHLPWQKGAVMPPVYFYFIETVSEWGWFFCVLISSGFVKFLYNLKNNRKEEDLFIFSISCVVLFFFTIWTSKVFRFILPVFPFLIYLAILGGQQLSELIVKKLKLSLRWQERLAFSCVVIALAVFMSKSLLVLKNIPDKSPYKMAADYIKKEGLLSDCYLSDERVVFQNYIQACTFWSQQDVLYNITGIIGSNISVTVLGSANVPFVPVKKPVKIFRANGKSVGVYLIEKGFIEAIKRENKKIEIQVVDKNNSPVQGAFIYLYTNSRVLFEGRTNAKGAATLLFWGNDPLMMRVEAWGKIPVLQEYDLKESYASIIHMKDSSFLINGLSDRQY